MGVTLRPIPEQQEEGKEVFEETVVVLGPEHLWQQEVGTLVDLYNVEVITEMEDTKRPESKKSEEMASLEEEENEDNDDPVSVELGELKARALRLSEQLALLSTSSKGLLEGDGEDQHVYSVGRQDPAGVIDHQVELDTSVLQQGLDEKIIGESELSSPESSLVETEDIPGMESVQERWGDRKSGMRRKMELKISSPTSSIMKSFSPMASPLSSPLSSPTKSSK